MKYLYLFGLLLFLVITPGSSQTNVMTYNLRYANPEDGDNYWELRKADVAELILFYQPDILGIQEGLLPQVTYLDEALEHYSYVGVGRDDGQEKGEYSAIFYKHDRFEVVKTQTYWLSETPALPSVGWDAALERIVTYALLKDKQTGLTFPVFNTHFDHAGSEARFHSAALILNLLDQKKVDSDRVVVLGDMNSEPGEAPVALFSDRLNDSFSISETPPYGPPGTYNRFNTTLVPQRRIDYIFTKGFTVQSYRQIDDRRDNGLYVSDHLPVLVILK